jgi:hypothetical protein
MKTQDNTKESFHSFFMNTYSNFVVYRLALGRDNVYGEEIEAFNPSVRGVMGISKPDRIES